MLRRVLQAYLTAAQTAEGVVAGADLNWADAERVGFALTNLVDALAPSNSPVLNPAALKAAIDTGGGSTLAGLRHFISDMAAPPRVPSVVEPDASEVGADLAVTPGLPSSTGAATWSPGSPTISVPGRAATGPLSCWAATNGSCCQRAGTSPLW